MPGSKPAHILLMEDNATLARFLQQKLEGDGYVVDVAYDGEEGLAMYETGSHDVLVVDQVMPVYDGLEVIRILASRGLLPPTIMVTGGGSEQIAVEAMKLGAYDYIVKDVEGYFELLSAVIERALRQYRLDQAKKKAEKELQESEERYRTVVEDMPAMICRFLPDGTLTFVNDTYCRYFNKNREDLINQNFLQFIPKEDNEKVKNHIMSLTTQDPIRTYEHQAVVDSGELRWQQWTDRALFDTQGNLIEYQSIGQDITDRKQAEEQLLHKHHIIDRIMKASPAGIMMMNAEGHIISISNRTEEMLGLSKEEIIQIPHNSPKIRFADTDNEPIPDEYLPFTRVIAAGETIYGMHYAFQQPDGKRVFLSVNGAPVLEESGEISGVVLTLGDITDHKQMMEDLKIRNDAIASFINAIAFTDLYGNITYVNPSFREMWGYDSEEDILGKPYLSFWHKEEEAGKMLNSLRRNQGWIGELVALRKNGSLFDVHLSVSTVKDESGKPVCIMGSFVDISEKVKMQKILAQSDKLSSLGQLSAGLSHELRNPLAVISSCAQFCLDTTELPHKVKENFQMIYRNSQRASDLIKELLEFAKPSEMVSKPVNINELVTRMLHMANLEAHSFHVTVNTHLGERLPEITGDEEKLGQVFLNLFMNAIQAISANGTITVRTRVLESRDLIEVNVIDDGPGIPEEYRQKIFEPFFTTKDGGTGLGLSISYTIVKQHRGSITAGSEGRRGTKMSVRLPIG
ncbi:MAG: PAS domain S-box protein [Syntrophales bacterium]|nr:PAS domain S-box protein [Syntrophales bacterium]